MGVLESTKYQNNIRSVSGTVTVRTDDVVLMCTTSSVACTINLLDIPENYWNTLYKLYVYDASGNASTNNITIVAPTGFLINGAQSITIASNNQGAIVRVGTNTQYNASVSSNGSGGFVDGMSLRYTMTDANTNFIPKVAIYSPAGTINPEFYCDMDYAVGLGTTHIIKNYDVVAPFGIFTSGDLANATGTITIPSGGDGVYLYKAQCEFDICGSSGLGTSALESDNANTLGVKWNNSALNKTAYMQCAFVKGSDANQITKTELTDMGNIKITVNIWVKLVAGDTVRLAILNNSDLDFYGSKGYSSASKIQVTLLRASN